jgi:hypothetical protein
MECVAGYRKLFTARRWVQLSCDSRASVSSDEKRGRGILFGAIWESHLRLS